MNKAEDGIEPGLGTSVQYEIKYGHHHVSPRGNILKGHYLIVDRQDDGHRIKGVLERRHLAEDSARRRCGYSMMMMMMMMMMMTLNRRILCSFAINIKK